MASTRISPHSSRSVLLLVGLFALTAPIALGQFNLPKVKVPKIGTTTPPAAKTPQGPTPAVASITPNSVPPGWEGQVVLTGSNFSKDMKLRFTCGYQTMKVKGFTVESAERAFFDLKVPAELEESKCVMAIEVPPPATAETGPTPQGSPQIVQVTGPSFSVSESSGLAKAFRACFILEGDVPPMQVMQAMAMAMQSGGQDECKLMVGADSIKYAAKGKVILDAPASAVKEIEPILVFGQASGTFRIVLASGKVYNFMDPGGSHDSDNPMTDQIKKKLKK